MKETFGQKTRRSHKRNQRVVMFWCAFVFAFVIAGVWLFRGTLFQNDSGASSSGTNQSRHDACGTVDSRQKVQMLPRRRWIMKSGRNCKTW